MIIPGERPFYLQYSTDLWDAVKSREVKLKELGKQLQELQRSTPPPSPQSTLELQRQLKAVSEGSHFTRELKLNHDITRLRVEPGQAIIFAHDWPHAGDVDGRNWRLFFSYGNTSGEKKTNTVETTSLLNCEEVLKLHSTMLKAVAGFKVPELLFDYQLASSSKSPKGKNKESVLSQATHMTRRLAKQMEEGRNE